MQRTIWATIPLMLAAGCASVPAGDLRALCDSTVALRTDHAAALVEDGGDASVVTGAQLISAVDAACPSARRMK